MTTNSLAAIFGSYIPEHLVPRLAAGNFPPPGVSEETWGVALFADVSGFTPLSEGLTRMGKEGAERLNGILYKHFGRMVEIIESWDGSVIKYGGDAAAVLFPERPGVSHETTCRRAIACAAEMMAAIREHTSVEVPELRRSFSILAKIGLACGPVRQLVLGDEKRFEYVAAGSTLFRMAEAEHHAQPGDIVATDEVAALVGPAGWIDVGDGFHRLEGSVPAVARPDAKPVAEVPLEIGRRFLHPKTAEQFEATGVASMLGEHRKVTTMFLAFDGLDYEGDPEAYPKLQEYFQFVNGVLLSEGGHLNQVSAGDKGSVIHILFGAPVTEGHDEEGAVRAGRKILSGAPGFITSQKIGINTGAVYCGSIGSDRRREYTALGDATNLAARLMGACEPGTLLCSDSVWSRTRDAFDWEVLPPIRVKGKTDPIAIYRPRGAAPRGAGVSRSAPRNESRVVGRIAELETAAGLGRRVVEGSGRWLQIEAAPGAGKSALAEEILTSLEGFRILRATALRRSRNTPYFIWSEVVAAILGVAPDSGPVLLREVLDRRLDLMGRSPDSPVVAQAFGWITGSAAVADDDPAVTQRIRSAIEALVETDELPTALLLEDCHELDPASKGALAWIVRGIGSCRLFLITTGMPGALASVEGDSERINLEPLTREETIDFVALMLSGTPGPGIIEIVWDRSSGNPLFAGEVVRHLRAIGAIAHDESQKRWYLASGFRPEILPESLNGIILARLDRLGELTRQTIRVASAFGRRFISSELAEVLPIAVAPADLQKELDTLAALEMVTPEGEGRWMFDKILVRDVAYESLSFGQRIEIHTRIGDRIEAATKDPEQESGRLALHFGLARMVEKAFRYSGLAASRALAAWAPEEARVYLDQAITLASGFEPDRKRQELLQWLPLRSRALEQLGDNDGARRDEALRYRLAHTERDDRIRATACLRLGEVTQLAADYRRSAPLARSAVRFARRADAPDVAIAGLALLAVVQYRLGDMAGSLATWNTIDAEMAALPAQRLIPVATRCQMMLNRGIALRDSGQVGRAESLLTEALDRAARSSLPRIETKLALNLSNLATARGDFDRALELIERADRLARQTGDLQQQVAVHNNWGTLLCARQDWDLARARFHETSHWARRLGLAEMEASATLNLGTVAMNTGDLDSARQLDSDAFDLFRSIGSRQAILARANLVEVLLAIGEGEVERELRQLVRDAHEQLNPMIGAWAHTELGKLFDRLARPEAAREEWSAAVRFATGQGHPAFAVEAEQLLRDRTEAGSPPTVPA